MDPVSLQPLLAIYAGDELDLEQLIAIEVDAEPVWIQGPSVGWLGWLTIYVGHRCWMRPIQRHRDGKSFMG